MEYENVWDDAHPRDVADNVVGGFESVAPVGSGGRSDFSEGLGDFEATLSDEPSLREHLTEQLALDILDGADRIIGLHLIDMLDDSGWLSGDTNEVASSLVVTKIESFSFCSGFKNATRPASSRVI